MTIPRALSRRKGDAAAEGEVTLLTSCNQPTAAEVCSYCKMIAQAKTLPIS
jgi:hypothetical protein